MTTPDIILTARIDLELVDYGGDLTARVTVGDSAGSERYLYEVDSDGGSWYARGSAGDTRVERWEVLLVTGTVLAALAESTARSLLQR